MVQPSLEDANTLVEQELDRHITGLETQLDADALTYVGLIYPGADDIIRDATEKRKRKHNKLIVILETHGGYVEVAERIADTFRHHYRYVEFIVPNFAMSAGTVLVMSGDKIHMDYYSILGPIDPQVARRTGDGITPVPALGYLIQYERLIEKSRKGLLTTAEMAFLIAKFDSGELYRYEQERKLSITLLKQWLVRYKFKDWKKTRTRELPVSRKMREERAEEIAAKLNNPEEWHTHNRGISMQVLRRKLKLEIEDFGQTAELNQALRSYYKLLSDYMRKRAHRSALHTAGLYVPIGG